MSNVRKGHDFEREVKKMFKDAGWFCTRAAGSMSPMDLIAYIRSSDPHTPAWWIFTRAGYGHRANMKNDIPLHTLWSQPTDVNYKHVYATMISNNGWTVVLMQCKIKKRRRAKARR